METNKIYCGDNLQIMKELPENSVDLIYLDPPFFSQKHYEQIWGDKAEVRSFEDRWSGGITHYVGWMVERLKEMHRILKPTGSIYLHCDWHASHYLKVEMDNIFGITNFRNEISVKRIQKNVHEYKKVSRLNTAYDSILFYSKSDIHRIIPPMKEDHKPSRWHSFDASGIRKGMDYELFGRKPPIGGHWRCEKTRSDDAIKSGILRPNPKTGTPEYLIPETTHSIISSAWYDIKAYSHKSGYPTEKSEELLCRIIEMSSEKNNIVFDPFCGCGTTAAVAKRLNRKFIGIDISPIACRLIATRIHYPEFDIIGLPMTTDDLSKMSHNEFQQWVCDKMMAKNTSPNPHQHSGGDGGIDGIIQSNLFTGKYAASPIQVTQSESVGVNKIRNFYAVMTTDTKKTKGFIIALSFGSGAVEQVAKYKKDHNVDIKLIKAEDLCNIQHYDYGVKIVNSEDI